MCQILNTTCTDDSWISLKHIDHQITTDTEYPLCLFAFLHRSDGGREGLLAKSR